MGFGPTGYFSNGTFIPFEKLDTLQKDAYERKASDIMKQLRTPREVNDTVLRQYLLQAGALGMLYTPDGKSVSQADVAKASENPETMFGFLADLIVVKPDIDHPDKNEYRSLQALNRNISVDLSDADGLYPSDLRRKQRTYLEKKQFTAQTEKISAMADSNRTKYLKDVKETLAKWSADGIEVGSPALKELLENAVEMGIVREVSGSTLTKETAAKFAERPAYLRNLVFIQQSEKDARDFDTYRLDVSDGNPQTVKMHPEKLASADIVQMDKDMEARGSREKLPSQFADRFLMITSTEIADYEKQMKEFGYKVKHLDGMQAFSLEGEKQVYFYDNPKPVSTPEDLIKTVRRGLAPKAPNKWGAFEGLRSFWHNHVSKLPDYEDYEREQGLYELDKYRLAKEAGLDVSNLEDTAKAAEEKYGSLYDAYRHHQEVEAWARDFDKHPMNAEEKAFVKEFTDAMKQYPDIAAQIMKDAPRVSGKMLDELLFTAQPYAELSQAGDFDKKKLGTLSALGVAAESGLFTSETREQIFGLCKDLNKDFGSTYGAEFLTAEQRQEVADVVVVGGSNENGVVDLDEVDLSEEVKQAARGMTEEEKAALADKIDGLTEGEKQTFEKLAKQYGFDLDDLDLNKTVSETVDEKTMDLSQMNV